MWTYIKQKSELYLPRLQKEISDKIVTTFPLLKEFAEEIKKRILLGIYLSFGSLGNTMGPVMVQAIYSASNYRFDLTFYFYSWFLGFSSSSDSGISSCCCACSS